MFTYTKVAQVAAFFVAKAGGTINIMKLIKLLYLADRESMDRYDAPITYDNFVAMDNGPVLSHTYGLIDGKNAKGAAQWNVWIGARKGHNVSLQKTVTDDALDQLSVADIEVMTRVWREYGKRDEWKLVEFTHDFAEWTSPKGSSTPIFEVDIFIALGRSKAIARDLAENIKREKALDDLFASV